jgi:hypothetical protein
MVSIANELLPEPLGPQKTVMQSRGISVSTDFKLCCSAPRTVIIDLVATATAGADFALCFDLGREVGWSKRRKAWPV